MGIAATNIEREIEFQRHSLPNGMTLVAERHCNVHTVSIAVWIKIGSAYENQQNNGINHFLEHMLFKGTATRSPFDIVTSFERYGGDLNAYTDREVTVYHGTVLQDHLSEAIEVLSDILKNATFPKIELERERKVLLQEMAMLEESPEEKILDQFCNLVWKNEPLGMPVIGRKEVVRKLNRNRLVQHYENYYRPENMVISVSGNFEFDRLLSDVEKRFSFPSRQKTLPLKLGPSQFHSRHQCIKDDTDQLHALIGFGGVGLRDPQRYEAVLVNCFLGGGMSGRFFQEVREKAGLAYTVDTDFQCYFDSGLMTVYVATGTRALKKCLQIIGRELSQLVENPMDESDLQRVKSQMVGAIRMASDEMEIRQESMARNEIVFGKYIPLETVLKGIQNVTAESLQRFCQKLFRKENESILTLGREKIKHNQLTVFS